MNLVDCYVTKVLSKPKYGTFLEVEWWSVEVEYNSWGTKTSGSLVFPTEAEASKVEEGYHFLA